jgi:septum formation protein
MTEKPPLILASTSPFRKNLLMNAGLRFTCVAPDIDERRLADPLESQGISAAHIARRLAIAKAENVSLKHPATVVIGCDQTLDLENQSFHKASTLEDARTQILALAGKTHNLHSAFAILSNGAVMAEEVVTAKMTMRSLSRQAIEAYINKAGSQILGSLGAYQIESLGITLFDAVDGDYFSILGLPLLPLLASLRRLEIIDA